MKINVSLEVPAIGEKYDVLIPDFLKIEKVVSMLSNMVEETSNRNYISSKREILCLKEYGILLSPQNTFEDYQIKNGDHIIMI